MMKFIFLMIIVSGFVVSAFSQVRQKEVCYQEKYIGDDKVFDKMEIYPSYKGEFDKLNQFLLQNIAINRITDSIAENTRFLCDTLQVRFIISKDRKMSNLLVTGTQTNAVKNELQRVLILSSCDWTPGEYGSRFLVGWFKKRLVFTLDRRGRYLSLKVEWLEPSNDMAVHNSNF